MSAVAEIPTVGRIVHYVAFGTPGGEYQAGAHRAAIVTEADPGNMTVSLAIFNPTGYHWRQGAPYAHESENTPGSWHWPERVERVVT